jgi:hypothetical protein
MSAPVVGLISAIVVPAVVIALAVLVTRNPESLSGGATLRRIFLGVGVLYELIGVVYLVASQKPIWGWIYVAMGALTLGAALLKSRKVSPS